MFNEIIGQNNKCYGCGACVVACPKNCLEIKKDDLGFKKIVVVKPEDCISCGLCSKVCIAKEMSYGENVNLKRFYGQHKDSDVLSRSSSGGAFTALAQTVFKENGYVWGVSMDDEGKNYFLCAKNIEELKKINGSKYVEVEIGVPFKEIEKQLNEDKVVLFSGTPCQVQSLNAFLKNKKYENLILVDLLCYGVQSPIMWKKYLEEINPKGKKIHQLQMRYKKPSWEEYSMNVEFEDGEKIRRIRWKDPYLSSYATNLYNREICVNCKAKQFPKISDITLGDFWQIDVLPSIPKDIKPSKGVSIVLTHTEKGEKYLSKTEDDFKLYSIPENVFTNMKDRFSGCAKVNLKRSDFISSVEKEGFSEAVKSNINNQSYAIMRFKWLKIKRLIKRVIKK